MQLIIYLVIIAFVLIWVIIPVLVRKLEIEAFSPMPDGNKVIALILAVALLYGSMLVIGGFSLFVSLQHLAT